MLISFEKSTSALTPPSIADDGILPLAKDTFLLNETSPKEACPLKLASLPTNILSGKSTSA